MKKILLSVLLLVVIGLQAQDQKPLGIGEITKELWDTLGQDDKTKFLDQADRLNAMGLGVNKKKLASFMNNKDFKQKIYKPKKQERALPGTNKYYYSWKRNHTSEIRYGSNVITSTSYEKTIGKTYHIHIVSRKNGTITNIVKSSSRSY